MKSLLDIGNKRERDREGMTSNFPSRAVQPGNDTISAALAGGPKMDPRRVSRLVKRTAVGEGERDGVSKG